FSGPPGVAPHHNVPLSEAAQTGLVAPFWNDLVTWRGDRCPTATLTPTRTPAPTATPTRPPTRTPTPLRVPMATPTPTTSPSATPTATPSPTRPPTATIGARPAAGSQPAAPAGGPPAR